MALLRRFLFLIFALVVGLFGFLAATENSAAVALGFLGASTPAIPVSWWLVIAFVGGVLVATVVNMLTTLGLRGALRRALKDNQKLRRDNPSQISSKDSALAPAPVGQ
mgnify:CR=1 FL=1|jgi:uncharacterized integral membrane protein